MEDFCGNPIVSFYINSNVFCDNIDLLKIMWMVQRADMDDFLDFIPDTRF